MSYGLEATLHRLIILFKFLGLTLIKIKDSNILKEYLA